MTAKSSSISGWAMDGVSDSLNAGIVNGRSASTLEPNAYITRAEAAKLIQELMVKSGLLSVNGNPPFSGDIK